jgi:phosphopantothenoylcysteine decarboxylase/phosphopantothenate--cysteine ligase
MTDDLLSNLRQSLEKKLSDLGVPARSISEKAGLNSGALSDIINGRSKNPGIASVEALAVALGSSVPELLAQDASAPSVEAAATLRQLMDGGLAGKTILLIIAGGIAAYKSLDLIRRLRERGAHVTAIMTEAAEKFVTPLAVGALTGGTVFTGLFDRAAEHDIGHIRLARQPDLIIIAPATADILARMAAGMADDLATAVLLATDKPVLAAPAMNPRMWANAATKRNVATLRRDGVHLVGPNSGEMAESGEAGAGRMAEPLEIAGAAARILRPVAGPLSGRHVVITSGPTHEPIDPVRYLANRSSGKQGHAIAEAALAAGARVTLVCGPVQLADPRGATTIHVETAREMLAAVEGALPADIAIMAAAVADWRVAAAAQNKIKKDGSGAPPVLGLTENPDILRTVSRHGSLRPRLVIGFAAETNDLLANGRAKLAAKGCDWIVANDVSAASGVMGGDENSVNIITQTGVEHWERASKAEVARRLIERAAADLNQPGPDEPHDQDRPAASR